MTNKITHTCFWALLLFVSISHSCLAQQRNTYTGSYKIGGYEGKAQYRYQVIGIDTIFDGPFKMERSNLEALLQNNDRSFLFEGSFDDGLPQSNWIFQFGEFNTDSTTSVSGFEYRVNVTGILKEAKGQLNRGKPEGIWKFSDKRIEDSKVLDTLFSSEVNFSNGVPQQSFTIENAQGTVIGRFLRNGLAQDTWSLFTNEAKNTENWSFDNGWLKQIEVNEDGNQIVIEVFEDPSIDSKIIDLDKGYSTLVSIYANQSSAVVIDLNTGINELLVQNSSNYNKIDSILSALGSDEFLEEFKVKAPYFPLDSLSKTQLDSTVQLIKSATETSKGFLENTRLNLIKRSDAEANSLYLTVAAIDGMFLRPLNNLVALNDMGVIEHLSREMLSTYLFPEGRPTPQVVVTDDDGKSQVFLGPNSNSIDFEKEGMAGYYAMANYVYGSLEQINETLGQKLADDKQQQEFVLLEEQMIAQANALNQFPDSVLQRLNKTELRALDNIKTTAEKLLGDYAEMPTGSSKLNQARMLINCLLHFDALSQDIIGLPIKANELEVQYTDAVFNPFTATIMDESIKKRITSAYKNVLLPYLLEKVGNDLNCENAEGLHALFEKSYERMVELRDEDTSKLERKLRKERNPKVILQLFNIKPLEE